MICSSTELELETIYNRIKKGEINLQPDFQRGDVWSIMKKEKLIDSILRGWKIPPIHVVENNNFVDEVLDGQQRLLTIRDFIEGRIRLDGDILPYDKRILSMDGIKYNDLDDETRRKFNKYSITIIRLTDYTPEEPAELFYRLNQPTTLTSAEQRNAFIGKTRNQIRNLVVDFEKIGANKYSIGFSNSRMAYDDIISKFCYTLELNTLRKRITSPDISQKYRNDIMFDKDILDRAYDVIDFLMKSIRSFQQRYQYNKLSLNKATLYSWLIFCNRYINKMDYKELGDLIFKFERLRQSVKGKIDKVNIFDYHKMNELSKNRYPFYESLILLFNQRASMGSTDVSSIITRDLILEIFAYIENRPYSNKLTNDDIKAIESNVQLGIERLITKYNWGKVLR